MFRLKFIATNEAMHFIMKNLPRFSEGQQLRVETYIARQLFMVSRPSITTKSFIFGV